MTASQTSPKHLLIFIVGLTFVLIVELALLACNCHESLNGYEMRREGYVFTKGSGFNPLKNIENSQVCLDWLGLKRCQKLLQEKNLWPLSIEDSKHFALLENLARQEADNSLNLYDQLYERLSTEQLQVFLSMDDSLTPYTCAGAEGSDIRTYTKAISILRNNANWSNYRRLQDLDSLSEILRGSRQDIVTEEEKLRQYRNLNLPPLSTKPLPPAQGPGFEFSAKRQQLLKKASQLNLHPLRTLISLQHLCQIANPKLQPQQAQECLIILERLRISSLRLSILHDEAIKLIPERQWQVLLLEPELKALDKRFVQDLLYPKTLHLLKESLTSVKQDAAIAKELNLAIPPIEREGPPPPKMR